MAPVKMLESFTVAALVTLHQDFVGFGEFVSASPRAWTFHRRTGSMIGLRCLTQWGNLGRKIPHRDDQIHVNPAPGAVDCALFYFIVGNRELG